MYDLAVARILHVLAVVLWIGGVAMVTLVLIPRVRAGGAEMEEFEAFERPFAAQSRWTVMVAGLSGFYLLWRLDLWARFLDHRYWWMHAMVVTWAAFAFILYVAEPLILRNAVRARVLRNLRLVQVAHWVLLAVSLATVAGAVSGSHGFP